jgi:hypothetical protein
VSSADEAAVEAGAEKALVSVIDVPRYVLLDGEAELRVLDHPLQVADDMSTTSFSSPMDLM